MDDSQTSELCHSMIIVPQYFTSGSSRQWHRIYPPKTAPVHSVPKGSHVIIVTSFLDEYVNVASVQVDVLDTLKSPAGILIVKQFVSTQANVAGRALRDV